MSGSQSQIDAEALAELLRAATEVETEAKAVGALLGDDIDDEVEDGPTVRELAAHVALLEDRLQALMSSSAPGEDPTADFDAAPADDDAGLSEGPDGLAAGVVEDAEFDPTLLPEGKADGWAACTGCGSSEVDDLGGGKARCEDCGSPLTAREAKSGGWEVGVDFEEPDDEPAVDVKELASAVLDVYQALGAVLGDAATDLADGPMPVEGDRLSEIELLMAQREGLSA